MSAGQHDDLLLLTLVKGLGPTRLRRCLEALGSASAVRHASVRDLAGVDGVGSKLARQIRTECDRLADGDALQKENELIDRHGVSLTTPDDEEYPALLRHIPDPPPLLYVRGGLEADDAVGVAIVGARKCTHYGREQADRLAVLCAQVGLCIVSGGAYGIDATAHRGAINGGGRTIAVLGSGIAEPYPPQHGQLFDEIAAGHGAVVSELPMSFPPMAENFPRRNRIISGLALGVLVIEASNRSGALITARLCAEDHGREVMALPGRVDSQASAGCHKMIREGWATLVTSCADILDALGETGQLLKAGATKHGRDEQPPPNLFEHNLTDAQKRIVDTLTDPCDLDAIAAGTGLSVQAIRADLTLLEIRGVVNRAGSTFQRKR